MTQTCRLPQRIACLSTETVEVIYALGEASRIVGISGFSTRPPQARKEKPKISGFSSAKLERILAVKPDLALGFSNLQAEIAADLVRAGVAVHVFNQRDIVGILTMIETVGRLIGAEARAAVYVAELEAGIERARVQAANLARRPRIYFEEWNEPLISGIRWVSQLIDIAGGEDIFAELSTAASARDRIIADPQEVVRRAPDIIIGSWCGKKFQPQSVVERPGWGEIPAVLNGELHEIKSPIILSPGPAALTDGLAELVRIIRRWAGHHPKNRS